MSRTLVRVLVLVLVLLLFRPKRPLISAGLDAVRWCKDPGLVLKFPCSTIFDWTARRHGAILNLTG